MFPEPVRELKGGGDALLRFFLPLRGGEGLEDMFGGIVDKAFSIAVSAFLLLRMERELKLLRASIDRLRHCSVCTISPLNETEENKKLWKAYGEGEGDIP